jgi:hypothetical protein
MKRTFNYTKRKKILREDVQLALIKPNDLPEVKVLKLNVSHLSLPLSAKVWFEFGGRLGIIRESLGTIGSLDLSPSFKLSERDLGNIRFRIKVVADELNKPGKLLAVVNDLELDDGGNVQSLLEVKPSENLEQRIWKIQISESGPELLINQSLSDWKDVGNSALFQSLVFPQAVYEIYKWLGRYQDYNEGTIEKKWADLFASTGHNPDLLQKIHDFEPQELYEEYLDKEAQDVAQSFARNHKALNLFNQGRLGG